MKPRLERLRLRRPRPRDLKALAVVGALIVAVMWASLGVVLARDPLPAGAAPDAGERLARLPLVEIKPAPGAAATSTMIVYFSGDNGWQGGDKGFAQGFARAGLPVVAIDSLHYFVRGRSRAGATADLAAVIDHYSARWNAPRVVLVGYSFGADALAVIARRLPPRLKAQVVEMALIAPVGRGELSLRPYALFDLSGPDAYSTTRQLEGWRAAPVVCVYGAQDWLAECPHFPQGLVQVARVPGGHTFKGQRENVARVIAAQALNQPSPSGGSPSPGPSARCISTTSTQRPCLNPMARNTPATSNPQAR